MQPGKPADESGETRTAALQSSFVPKWEPGPAAPEWPANPTAAGMTQMIPELGHFALALAVALAGAQAMLPLWGAHTARRAPDGRRAGAGYRSVHRAGDLLWLPGLERRGR